MKPHFVILSQNPIDLEFGRLMAQEDAGTFEQLSDVELLRNVATKNQNAVVFWDTENPDVFQKFKIPLSHEFPVHRIFSIAEKSPSFYSHLKPFSGFGHHLLRRFGGAAVPIYSQMAKQALKNQLTGLESYFSKSLKVQQIEVTRSSHKNAAVEAVQSYLTKTDVPLRMAALIAQSVDELILNAIFDAPLDGPEKGFHEKPRTIDIALPKRQAVEVKFVSGGSYMGICVTDQYGSLTQKALLRGLYRGDAGLRAIYKTGLSQIFVLNPRVKTEAILLFPLTHSFKDFRNGFRFLSIIEQRLDEKRSEAI